MVGTKYLSEAIDQNSFRSGCLNLVYAPVGCGKTYWALNCLAASMKDKNKMLYLIDTTNGRDKLLKREDTMFYTKSWRDHALLNLDSFGDTKVVVMTYAKFGMIVSEFPQFGNTFKYIICDELHNLPRFAEFRSEDPDNKVHTYAWIKLTDIINSTKVIVIGLSATPERLIRSERFSINYIPVDKEIRHYEIEHTQYYSNIDELLKTLSSEKRYLLYTARINDMKHICELAKGLGFQAIAIWSINQKEKPMSIEQLIAREEILRNERIPDKYNFAVINASSETAINLFGTIDGIIIHSNELEAIIQVRGRYRNDLDTLYLYDSSTIREIPSEYLNIRLYKEDKERLCETIKLRNEQGRILKWTSVKEKLVTHGYTIIEGRSNNKRFSIINKQDAISQ